MLSLIQNDQKQFLVQKRSAQKNGKYGFTGGHAKTGENSIQAIITEIGEEIGISVYSNELNLYYSGRDEDSFFDLYYLSKDLPLEHFSLQKEEVDFVEWLSYEDIKKLHNSGLFQESHYEALEIYLNAH